MKVALINSSPHEDGCTNLALETIKETLADEGIEGEIIQIGLEHIHSCIACSQCLKTGKCSIDDDCVNEFIDRLDSFDGFVFGAPVYYGSVNSNLLNFMTRLFYAGNKREKNPFRLKPAAAVTSARRAGTMTSIDIINRFFTISQMVIISSTYWNEIHGNCKEEALQDAEALETMETLAKNMAWFLKIKQLSKKEGIPEPECKKTILTNFIR